MVMYQFDTSNMERSSNI